GVNNGWRFSFDATLYDEANGLGPEAGYNVTLASTSPAPLLGDKRLDMASGSSAVKLSYDAQVGQKKTAGQYISAWISVDSGGWSHYVGVMSGNGDTTTLLKNNRTAAKILSRAVTKVIVHQRGVDRSDKRTTETIDWDERVILPFAVCD